MTRKKRGKGSAKLPGINRRSLALQNFRRYSGAINFYHLSFHAVRRFAVIFQPRRGWIPKSTELANPIMQRFWNAAEMAAIVDGNAHRALATAALRELSQTNSSEARLKYAKALEVLGYFGVALRVRMEGIEQGLDDANYWWLTIDAANEAGNYERARTLAAIARARFPDYLEFYLADNLMAPVLYDSAEQVAEVRERVMSNLDKVVSEGVLTRPENIMDAVFALRRWKNFYLVYQGRDDRSFQESYASLVTEVMNEAVTLAPRGFVNNGRRIRVGFASELFRMHAVSRTFQGWIKYLNREQFETRLYHFHGAGDRTPSHLADYADHYVQLESLDELIAQLYADELDVLIYLDVGMSAAGLPAALRLAPVQCTTWGHPVTSGLPSIDFFLSGESIEPPDSQRHYSEKLVKLPGPGVAYDRPQSVMPLNSFSRHSFGMRERSTVYLCTQSAFKYLPQHDWVIAEIAHRVPDSQFAFIIANRELAKKLLKRLDREFVARGLSVYDYAIVFPQMEYFLYRHVYSLGDAFLDSIGFSSFNTALDAVAHNLPIVTCRAATMRGRLASSVAEGVGLDELISDDVEGYVDNAVRLARDPQFHNSMVERIKANSDEFFADRRAVRALEDFLRNAVSEARRR